MKMAYLDRNMLYQGLFINIIIIIIIILMRTLCFGRILFRQFKYFNIYLDL